ncbi:hybrid sensor histidine kinase/response regulator transcription factor [Algoriphagus sp.]|uniref:hybrid sensor histidine kinase/response regulator transcription factor n=1 Tax=Algoriphagus sp. TaxID=1872435 RepID=UPI003F7113A5
MEISSVFRVALFFMMVFSTLNTYAQLGSEDETHFEQLLDRRKLDSALWLARHFQTINPTDQLIQAQGRLMEAYVLYTRKRFTDALSIADSLLLNDMGNSPELTMKSLLLQANIANLRMENESAIALYLKIDSIAQTSQTGHYTQVKALTNLGVLSMDIQEANLGKDQHSGSPYFSKALEITRKTGDSLSYYDLLTLIASREYVKGKIDPISKIYIDAIEYFKKEENHKLLHSAYWGLANAYEKEGMLQKAEKVFLENIQFNWEQDSLSNFTARAFWIYASFLNRTQQLDLSILNYEKARDLFQREAEPDIGPLIGTTYNLATLYRQTGAWQKAYDYLYEAWAKNDSVNQFSNFGRIAELERKYQTAEKEAQIQSLHLAAQRKSNQFLLLLLIVVSIISVIGFYLYRQKQKIKIAKKIAELDEFKNRFFENIAHELRTPISLISSPVQLLEVETKDHPEFEPRIQLIKNQSQRLLGLVDQILSLQRLENAEIKVLFRRVILDVRIMAWVKPFEVSAKTKNIQWKNEFQIADKNVWIDEDLFQKGLDNLLGNALKHTPKGGQISFQVKHQEHLLEIQLRNSAPNLNKKDLPRLFDRYYQKSNDIPGAGIGLSLVKLINDRLGGKLRSDLEGGEFVLRWQIRTDPEYLRKIGVLVPQSTQSDSMPSEISDDESKPLVLIVEDYQESATLLASLVGQYHRISVAYTGEQAWQSCLSEVPDLVITDIQLPDLSGLKLCNRIKTHEILSHIPVILLTASGTDTVKLQGIESGADVCMTKPFVHGHLLGEIDKLIDQRNKLRERYSKEVVLKPLHLAINSAEERFLEKLQSVVEENMENPEFAASRFAEEMGLSRMQLHRKLKHLTGLSAMEFLKDQRLKTASMLLMRGDLSVSEVAYAVGFNDLSHFSKSFKHTYGENPSEYLLSQSK